MSAVQEKADEGPEDVEENSDELPPLQGDGTNGRRSPNVNATPMQDVQEVEEIPAHSGVNGTGAGDSLHEDISQQKNSTVKKYPILVRPSSADGSSSIPDETPSIAGSFASSPSRAGLVSRHDRSPTPSVRAFDRRFHARNLTPLQNSLRSPSPAFLNVHSRQSSTSHSVLDLTDAEIETPWEVVRWTKLRKMTSQASSEAGRRQFGRPTCIAVSASIALGTSKGLILVFDYNQDLKSVIGQGTKAAESGSVTSISISADHSTIAGGHASGNIFTWELSKPAKPFLHIPPVERTKIPSTNGHVQGVAILHLGFLGIRHTALTSADDKGMAFSHLATRGMGAVARSVRTTRILGRYPEANATEVRSKKPSSVLSFSPLPLGNAEHTADSMGLVAMLTPYLLVVVSTMPIAQTQFKAPRPKEVAPHGTMTAALAWFPSVKLKALTSAPTSTTSKAKLVYSWSNVLAVLDVHEVAPSDADRSEPPSLQFKPRSKWRAQEAIVAVQWLSRSVLAVLTITQQLVVLEDVSMIVTDSSDLIQRHIYHQDLFSQQLDHLVDRPDDEEVAAMHGVVADAFYMSFRAYKGRLFLLGHNDVSFGTLSNWADRLLALMEDGQYIEAIRLATAYYAGKADKVTVGLPEDDVLRHQIVHEKIVEMMLASLRYSFGRQQNPAESKEHTEKLEQLASACITACVSIEEMEFLFDDIFTFYQDADQAGTFLKCLEPFIVSDQIVTMPPTVLKSLVIHYTDAKLHATLEEMICRLDPRTMDIDQITGLCKAQHLYDALLYVWSQGLGDYTTVLNELFTIASNQTRETTPDADSNLQEKIFPYLSYTLTGRIYPTGKDMHDDEAILAKAGIYSFFFSGGSFDSTSISSISRKATPRSTFLNLRRVVEMNASSFFSMLNEAFEDSFLNGPQERMVNEIAEGLTEEQRFGLSINRQWIVSILLEAITAKDYGPHATVYLDMFVARNLPKFPQFILLPGNTQQRILVELCEYSDEQTKDDCELSVEYLLSKYQAPDLEALIPIIHRARFYRVLKSIYRSEAQYAKLLQICFEDRDHQDDIFDCIRECMSPGANVNQHQLNNIHKVILEHAHELVTADVTRAASSIARYAPDLHRSLLLTLVDDELAQYQYLRTVLEPEDCPTESKAHSRPSRNFIEQYVRLLCQYDSAHVGRFVEQIKQGDIRLEEVLPALEQGGAIDAAVVLMAREGQVRNGMSRLVKHLHTLEAALSGLIGGIEESPDLQNATETGLDLVLAIQKFARVGIWICRTQTKAAAEKNEKAVSTANAPISTGDRITKTSIEETLSPEEELWLDLIDAIVAVAKNITEQVNSPTTVMQASDNEHGEHAPPGLGGEKLVTDLRSIVQETFTALLSATIPPRSDTPTRADAAFLRILKAFLSRASRSSPSLSNLRGVLSAIFSAYSHEESLLSLSNRLLDKDLFVHVTEADKLRRRGWRPLGQVCEGCGRRVWGPGAGASVWDAWQLQNEQRERRRNIRKHPSRSSSRDSSRNGKGKAVPRMEPLSDNAMSGSVDAESETSAVVIFSCRHLFHRSCLEKMLDQGEDQGRSKEGPDLICPLEP